MAHQQPDRMVHRVKRQLVTNGLTFYAAGEGAAQPTSAAAAATTAAAARTTVARVAATTTSAAAAARTTTTRAATTTARTTATSSAVSVRPDWRSSRTTAEESTSSSSAASSAAVNAASSSSRSSSAAKSTGSAVSDASSTKSTGVSGGAVAGIIIAIIAVVLIGGGFWWWKKKRSNRQSATNLMGGAGDHDAGMGGMYNKRHETADSELFANSSASPNGSWSGGEKFPSSGAAAAGAGAGYGSMAAAAAAAPIRDNDPWATQQQQAPRGMASPPPSLGQPQQQHNSWASSAPSSAPQLYGQYPSAHVPGSTVNLLPAPVPVPTGAGSNSMASSPFSDPHHQSIEQRELQQELNNRRQSMAAKTQSAALEAAAAAGAASPFGESEGQGEIRIVKGTFDPTLEDELVLYPGDRVQVLMKYDDGWALGLNLNSGHPPAKGVFPFDCLGELAPPPAPTQIRTASPNAQRALSPTPSTGGAAFPAALQPGSPPAPQGPPGIFQRGPQQQAPVDPALVPLPPASPTPTPSLAPIAEDSADSTPRAATPTQPAAAPAPASVPTSSAAQFQPLSLSGMGSDSPLSASFPPLSSGAPAVAPIVTSSPVSVPAALPRPSLDGGLAPVKQQKRHSSLIASRDADLFVALGEVLGETKEEEGEAKKDGSA
ncbi:hypothetical protein JCM8097_005517 [Rhodosporidiobolus ruineniae]